MIAKPLRSGVCFKIIMEDTNRHLTFQALDMHGGYGFFFKGSGTTRISTEDSARCPPARFRGSRERCWSGVD